MAIVGPGSVQEQATDVKPILEGASEYEYVTILNPLSDDFAIRVAQDVPVNMPVEIRAKTGLVQSSQDVVRSYGLDLKNPDYQARQHIYNDAVIKAGQTINLKGNEAQVAVRQLVNEIMQRENNRKKMADPVARREVEERIVIKRGLIEELMQSNFQTPRQQIDEAIKQSNEVNNNESAFPGLSQNPATSESGAREVTQSDTSDSSSPKRLGRPKKTD